MTAADKNTQISQQNNVPIINIATPNGAGISHNKFQQFNVDKQGAVLNNATANVNSQIAGQIKTNANLKGKSANLIINEVTGSSRSELQGKLEVAGKGASVLIANPSGITCNGCSFVNTPAITLTTGKPILDNKGALSAVEVKKGSVVIGANGLNAEAQTYADIISRATELNGQIKAKNLTLMQGTNRVDFQKGTVTPIAGEGAKPSISVDTKALGGMYANQVKLVSTEAGVGINLSNVQINQNDLTLTVDGKITLAGNIQGKKDINVSTKNLQINANANVNAAKDITLATNTLTNNGKIIAGKDMRVFAESVSNTGNSALIQAQDNLWMQKNAKGDLSTLIENKSGTIKTNAGDLVIRTKKLNNERQIVKLSEGSLENPKDNRMLDKSGKLVSQADIGAHISLLFFQYKDGAPVNQKNKKWFDTIQSVDDDTLYHNNQTSLALNIQKKLFGLNDISPPAIISSAKNIYINANELSNNLSEITSLNNIIITGSNFFNNSLSLGWHKKFEKVTYNLDSINPIPLDKLTTVTFENLWHETKLYQGKVSAKNNLVIDMANDLIFKINGGIENQTYNEKWITEIPKNFDANNILLKSKNISGSGGFNATNDLTVIGDKNIALQHVSLFGGKNVSLIANENILLSDSQLKGSNLSILSKVGDLKITNDKGMYLNKSRLESGLFFDNSITMNVGNNIHLESMSLNGSPDYNISAGNSIHISKQKISPSLYLLTDTGTHDNLERIQSWNGKNLYLSAKNDISIAGASFNFTNSISLNAGNDLYLTPISMLSNTAIHDKDALLFRKVEINALNDITFNVGRDFYSNASNIYAKKLINLLTGRNIHLYAAKYSAIPTPDEDNQDVRYVTSVLSGDKGVTLASNGALTAQGSTIKSLGDITISSGGNVRLESVKTHYRKQSGKRLEDLYRQIGTEINSGKTLTILSEGSILFQASRLVAKGTMDIAAKGGYLYAQAMEETSHYEESGKKCNKWTACITKKEVKKTRSETINKVTEFAAGGDINLYAKDDVTLEATKINSGKNAKITSQTGKVNFKAVKNTTFEQVISNSKGFYISQRNKGYKEDTWILPALHIGGKLTIDAAKGITADIKAKNAQSLQNALNSLGQTEGTKWLAGLKDRKDVQWGLVQDAYDSWDYKSQSLNPVASALIMIAVSAMTSGYGLASWAADGAVTTTGATGITANVISGAAYSGMTALTSQAAVALAENQGNLSKTLSSLGKSDTVKSIITQMVISGALNGLDVKMEWNKGNPADAKLPLLSNGDWNKVAQRVAAQSVISSTVNTTIQGGSFTDNFKNALLSNIGNQVNAEGVKLIGDKGELLTEAGKTIPHAAVAAISAEISNSNVRGAIVGVLAAQIAGITINDNLDKTDNWQEQQAQISRIAGAFAGLIATGKASGINSAANSAEIVERYNRQLHLEEIKAVNELANGDKNKLERLLASSCRKVNCIVQESLESSERAYYESLMKKYPSTYIEDSLLADYWITKERKVVGNYPAFGGYESMKLFTYSKIDSSTDIDAFVFNQWIENASNYTGWSKKNLEDLYFATTIGAMAISRNKTNNIHKPLSIGSTGRNIPRTLNEKLALEQAISNPTAGRQLPVPMTDKRWPGSEGWVKMSQNINGIEVHYVRNTKTGDIDDFKFK
nr:DUF637 domain-containing protein [Providencia rettgeri]